MIRRLSAAVAAVVLVGTATSGCSTFSKNSEAARVGGESLSVDDFETMASDIAGAGIVTGFTLDEAGELTGDNARLLIQEWITSHLFTAALAKAGTPVDDAALAAAEATLTEANSTNWTELSEVTKQFLIEDRAAITLTSPEQFVTDADAKAAYDAGPATSKTLCIRFLAPPDEATADDLHQQLEGGADFATLANSADGGSSSNGGILADPNSGVECVESAGLNSVIFDALAGLPAGAFSKPTALSGTDGSSATYIFLQRPWDEVVDTALPLVRAVLTEAYAPQAQAFRDTALTEGGVSVRVDSRYGMWDAGSSSVLPSR